MPQRNLIAAKFPCPVVQMPPAHPGTEVAGRFPNLIYRMENICLKHMERYAHPFCIAFNQLPFCRQVARVHHHKFQPKFHLPVFLKLLEQLCHQHRVFPARNADGYLVPLLHQLIIPDCLCKPGKQLFVEFLLDALFNFFCIIHIMVPPKAPGRMQYL